MRFLLISPTPWGRMRLSKHHIAVQLARRGHDVTFLNPADRRAPRALAVHMEDGVRIVTFRPKFPLRLRFYWPWMYRRLMSRQVRRLVEDLGGGFDVAWCFEFDAYPNLRWFGARLAVYHPMEQVELPEQVAVCLTADLVLTVSPSIAERLGQSGRTVLTLPHGLAAPFEERARVNLRFPQRRAGMTTRRAGYVGNLFIPELDRHAFRQAILAHSDVVFEFWGPVKPQDSNVGSSASAEVAEFIEFLRHQPNVLLHGVMSGVALADAIAEMDVMLICYDIANDRNGGVNSHKVLEYLSVGCPVVATPVADYISKPGLLEMSHVNGDSFVETLTRVLASLEELSSADHRRKRIEFALQHTYDRHMQRCERLFKDVIELGPSGAPAKW